MLTFIGFITQDDEPNDMTSEVDEVDEIEEENINEEDEKERESDPEQEELEEEENTEEVPKENSDEESVEEESEEVSWDDIKNTDNIVGKSDKDISELSTQKPRDVRNDNTGNWKMSTINEAVNLEEYALSYRDEFMEEDEVHFMVNFAYNTTITLNDLGGILYVEVTEYEKREEHDASTLGSGMLLGSYNIYPDGDIEEVEI